LFFVDLTVTNFFGVKVSKQTDTDSIDVRDGNQRLKVGFNILQW